MHALEAGDPEAALLTLLDLDQARGGALRALLSSGARRAYRRPWPSISPDAEGTYFVYRLQRPDLPDGAGAARVPSRNIGA